MTVDERIRRAADELRAEVPHWSDPEAALAEVVSTRRRSRGAGPLRLAAAVLVAVVAAAVVVVLIVDDGAEDVATQPRTSAALPQPTTPGPATGASEGLEVTAEPAAGLVEGDPVQVTAAGLPADAEAGFVLCRADALLVDPGMERCQLGPEAELRPDAEGRIEGSIAVERLLTVGNPPTEVDCSRDVRCGVGVVVITREPGLQPGEEIVTFELRGLVAIELAPQERLEPPVAAVVPAEGLRHGQVVTISGTGFAGSVDSASLCAPGAARHGAGCTSVGLVTREALAPPMVDGAGRFSVEVPVWRVIPIVGDDGSPRLVDCAEVACTLSVESGDGRPADPVPLAFDRAVPVPDVPTLTVEPATGLRPGQDVTVTVGGLTPGVDVQLSACAIDATLRGACSMSTSLAPPEVADADGTLTLTVAAVDPSAFGVDCSQAGRCGVRLGGLPMGDDPVFSLVDVAPVQYAP